MPPSEMQAISEVPPADVDDHVAFGRFDVEPRAQRGGHRFVDHVDLAPACVFGRVAHGADLDVSRSRRDADHHFDRGREEMPRTLDLLYHAAQHQFGGREIGDHAVFQGADRFDVGVGLLMHGARPFADGNQLAGVGVDGDDRRLVHHHAAVVDDQGIGRTEVDGQLLCQRKKSHMFFLFIISILSGFRAGTAGVWGSHLQR